MPEKVCTKCGEAKPGESFPKDLRLRSGLSSQCRACHAVRSRRSYENNRDQRIARSKQWAIDNPERFKELQLKSFSKHEKISPEEWAVRKAATKIRTKQEAPRRQREWAARNPERHREIRRRVRIRRNKSLANAVVDLTTAQWEAIKTIYRHRCAYCGEKKPLTQDHVIPISKGGHHTASNIVPACQSCNSRKGAGKPKAAFQPHLI